MIAFIVVLATSLLLSLALTPLAARLGRRWGLVAVPDERRRHQGIIPRSGGLAIYVSCAIAMLIIPFLPPEWMPPTPEGPDPNETTRLAGVLIGMTVLAAVGVVDDRKELSARAQFAAHLLAALIAIAFLIFIEVVNNPFTDQQVWISWPLPILITVFWITGMISTVNFLDGLDGLAAGVTAICSLILTIHMVREQQYSVALLPLALFGAMAGFLPFNAHPARIFMGSGAHVVGYALGTLSIIAGARVATILLVMGIPIVDVAWQAYSRWRGGKAMGGADRGHLHYRLQDAGLSQRQIVAVYCLFSAAFGALALLLSHRIYKLGALVILGGAALALLFFTTRRAPR